MKLTTTEVLHPRDTVKETSAFASFLEATGPLKKKRKIDTASKYLKLPQFYAYIGYEFM